MENTFFMEIFFMEKVLNKLSDVNYFKKIFASFLRYLGAFAMLGNILFSIVFWDSVIKLNNELHSALLIFGAIITQVLIIVLTYMITHIYFIRANTILALTYQNYIVIPVISVFFKLIGEIYAAYCFILGIAAGILVWFVGGLASNLLPIGNFYSFSGWKLFPLGIVFMFIGVGIGYLFLIFFYLLSEATIVFVDIANNMKVNRQINTNIASQVINIKRVLESYQQQPQQNQQQQEPTNRNNDSIIRIE